jgi:hypothetical protein
VRNEETGNVGDNRTFVRVFRIEIERLKPLDAAEFRFPFGPLVELHEPLASPVGSQHGQPSAEHFAREMD